MRDILSLSYSGKRKEFRLYGLVWQKHVQNRTKQSSGLLVLKLVKSDDVI
jgi:hypothetical protein